MELGQLRGESAASSSSIEADEDDEQDSVGKQQTAPRHQDIGHEMEVDEDEDEEEDEQDESMSEAEESSSEFGETGALVEERDGLLLDRYSLMADGQELDRLVDTYDCFGTARQQHQRPQLQRRRRLGDDFLPRFNGEKGWAGGSARVGRPSGATSSSAADGALQQQQNRAGQQAAKTSGASYNRSASSASYTSTLSCSTTVTTSTSNSISPNNISSLLLLSPATLADLEQQQQQSGCGSQQPQAVASSFYSSGLMSPDDDRDELEPDERKDATTVSKWDESAPLPLSAVKIPPYHQQPVHGRPQPQLEHQTTNSKAPTDKRQQVEQRLPQQAQADLVHKREPRPQRDHDSQPRQHSLPSPGDISSSTPATSADANLKRPDFDDSFSQQQQQQHRQQQVNNRPETGGDDRQAPASASIRCDGDSIGAASNCLCRQQSIGSNSSDKRRAEAQTVGGQQLQSEQRPAGKDAERSARESAAPEQTFRAATSGQREPQMSAAGQKQLSSTNGNNHNNSPSTSINSLKVPQATSNCFMSATPPASFSSSSSTSSNSSFCNGVSPSGFQSPPVFACQPAKKLNSPVSQLQRAAALASFSQQPQQAAANSNSWPSEVSPGQARQLNQEQQRQPQQSQQPIQPQYPPNHPLGNTKHLCSICGDRATGKHYGVYSCEGCKGFFKRTIRKDIVYVCRAQGDCLIDMRQRNRCQYCRYQKCLRQGMKREAVQEEKQRLKLRAAAAASNQINQSDLIRSNNNNNCDNNNQMIADSNNNNLAASNGGQLYPAGYNGYSAGYASQHNLSSNYSKHENLLNTHQQQTTFAGEFHDPHYHQHHLSDSQSQAIHNHHHQQQLMNPVGRTTSISFNGPTTNHPYYQAPMVRPLPVMRDTYGSHYNATGNSDFYLPPTKRFSAIRLDDMTLKWAAQLQIDSLIYWAKGVPHFKELLIDDQITLLKAYWNELIIADIAFKSIDAIKENNSPYYQRSLCIGKDLFINESQAYEIGFSNMFDRIIDDIVMKFHNMKLDAYELACLRAIILFNPETHSLKTSQPIEEHRGNVYTMLELYCRKSYENQPNRFGKLLLRLPALRSIGLKCDSMKACDIRSKIKSGDHRQSPLHTNSATPMSSSSSTTSSSASNAGSMSPANAGQQSNLTTNMLGYQVKLLFFDLCYESSTIDSFLRSNLMH